ncbi:MAG: hypothetical protein AAF571_02955 [Verrucomicrobiota bacterium]
MKFWQANIMKAHRPLSLLLHLTFFTLISLLLPAVQAAPDLPDPLVQWQDWATWDVKDQNHPPVYNNSGERPGLWPSQLSLNVSPTSGTFSLRVTTYGESWITLPGTRELWPQDVKANGRAVAVTEHRGKPAVFLTEGFNGTFTGSYHWTESPQRFQIPVDTGLLRLTVNGKANPNATWDANGNLWLKNRQPESAEKDFMSLQVYRLVRDGIPMWLTSEIEVKVSGKSREETIGHILPTGWKLSSLQSPIPVAVDESGLVKAQVRAGTWIIRASAFHLTDVGSIRYPEGIQPPVAQELIAFQSKPDFRLSEITGIPMIDASQTTLPQEWRDFPVYQWTNDQPFQIEERMRGMGIQKPEGLHIERELWLDQDARSLTFRDAIDGTMQEIWRLDVTEGRELGSVRVDGEGQLVTVNPETEARGVEIRTRNLNLQATGRMPLAQQLSATGWQTDADHVRVSMNLPPGWRLFAVLGADWVDGDWLTSWTLLDLFLLLVFSIAVAKMWNLPAGLLAFFAFGLSYHEYDAPRYLWFFLLAPLALQNVLKTGKLHKLVIGVKFLILSLLVLCLIPFIGKQLQSGLYPQLEETIYSSPDEYLAAPLSEAMALSSPVPANQSVDYYYAPEDVAEYADKPELSLKTTKTFGFVRRNEELGGREGAAYHSRDLVASNLAYDSKARIQTGPGIPEWSWNKINFGWNGPVTADQTVRPILIPLWLQRVLILLRVALLILLVITLVQGKIPQLRIPQLSKGMAGVLTAITIGLLCLNTHTARAEYPDQQMLDTLRTRLLEPSPVFPHAAEIPNASISLRDNTVTISAEIHTADRTAVPLPGRISSWSPLSVSVNGRSTPVLRRANGFLWVVLDPGVHQVRMQGLLSQGTEWEWTFMLRPRQVRIEAPGWNHTGVKPNGVPESQIFFSRQQKTASGEASYDHHETEAVVVVDRHLETGLVWRAQTNVRRLSGAGKAVSLRVPLLPGEKVLSSNIIVKENHVEVRLGAQQNGISWSSELPITPELKLVSSSEDLWIERWYLTNSPVWNVSLAGLAPVFEQGNAQLTPVWHPWPGESVALTFSRPQAVAGETATISSINHEIWLGARQRASTLEFIAECSLGQDFPIKLPENAEISSVYFNGQNVPARIDNGKLMIALKPGSQQVEIKWTENLELGWVSQADAVEFPVEVSNINTRINIPENRWTLWAHGPLQGPAVRFWVVLTCSLLIALILSRLPHSPLKPLEWLLLAIGLTQIHMVGGLFIAGWFFLMAWRGRSGQLTWPAYGFNALQVVLVATTTIMIALFVSVVSKGLLGDPDMFINGNRSYLHALRWYQPSTEGALPSILCVTVSIWLYRFLMLLWALWLAFSLIRWMKWGWQQFSASGYFRPIKFRNPFKSKMPQSPEN